MHPDCASQGGGPSRCFHPTRWIRAPQAPGEELSCSPHVVENPKTGWFPAVKAPAPQVFHRTKRPKASKNHDVTAKDEGKVITRVEAVPQGELQSAWEGCETCGERRHGEGADKMGLAREGQRRPNRADPSRERGRGAEGLFCERRGGITVRGLRGSLDRQGGVWLGAGPCFLVIAGFRVVFARAPLGLDNARMCREEDLSTEPRSPQAHARLSEADEHQRRSPDLEPPSSEGPQAPRADDPQEIRG